VVAGTSSGVGKTTVATGLMAALRAGGTRVAAAKVGPDFIDPGYHALATGRSGRNLDPWMCGAEVIPALAARAAAGCDVLVVEGGDAAVAALCGPDAARIDCVVLDLVMPDLDGLGVLARMREAGSTVPVIVQTAHGGIDNVVSAMRAGAVDFVVKPVGAERLQVSLRNALEKSALADELGR